MEEGQKKVVKVIVVIACLAAAGIIYKMTSRSSGGLSGFKRGVQIWIKCNNLDCGHEDQIDKKDYFEYQEKHWNPKAPLATPTLVCSKCSEHSVYRAVKCPKCQKVFFYGASESYPDKCLEPECGYSAIESGDFGKGGGKAK